MTTWRELVERSPAVEAIDADAGAIAASRGRRQYGLVCVLRSVTRATCTAADVANAYVDVRAVDDDISRAAAFAAPIHQDQVEPAAELDLLAALVARIADSTPTVADVVHGLTILPGGHTRHLDDTERAIRRQLQRARAAAP